MPPDHQQETSSCMTGNGLPAANTILSNRTDTVLVHAQPPVSANNVSPCSDDDGISVQIQEPPLVIRFSILRESLHPVTLKVP